MTHAAANEMPSSEPDTTKPVSAAVRIWLLLLAVLVVTMVVVGGATRLTDSGLSITEWQLITGTIPPLTGAAWQEAFAKYQQIPEYSLINHGMSLDEFKFIYWWEWSHRFLGRFIGIVFIIPCVLFWMSGQIPRWLAPRLVIMLLLGGAQGALGWYMVSSGLVDRVDVSQYRLAAHLGLAVAIFGFIWWTFLTVSRVRGSAPAQARGRRLAHILAALVFLQVLLGGLVAGLDAGMGYATWPLMDGAIIPHGLLVMQPWYLNLFENALTVQFDHRLLAYVIWLLAGWHALRATADRAGALLLFALVTLQAGLGIWTLLAGVPLSIALWHQLGAVVVFATALLHLARLTPLRNAQALAPPLAEGDVGAL